METKTINGHTYQKVQGGWQLVKPQAEKPQRGFAGEMVPTAFSIAGGMLGSPLGIPGMVAGAGAGGALGERVQQGIEKKYGQREEIDNGQVVATGAIDSALQLAGVGVAKTLGKVGMAGKPYMIKFLKTLSGYNDELIETALKRSAGVVEGMKGGEKTLVDVVKRSTQKLAELAKKSVFEAKEELATLAKSKLSEDSLFAKALQSTASKYQNARTEIFNKVGDFTKSVVTNLRTNNIGVTKDGGLVFSRANQPSRIVSGSEQKAVQEAYEWVSSLKKNLSLKHVDAVFERLIVLKSKTPVGTPTGTETKALIGNMIDDLYEFVGKVYPKEYIAYLDKNLQKRVFINQAQELLGDSAHVSPKEQVVVMNRLYQLFNTGKLPAREFLGEVGDKIGEDIVGTTAGTAIKTSGQVSLRAQNLTAVDLLKQVVQAIPKESLKAYIRTGNLTGDLLTHPAIVRTAKVLNISTKALMVQIANILANKTSE